MRIAPHPPHRSVRALLVHTAPTSDVWRQTAHSEKDEGFGEPATNEWIQGVVASS
jgi:hypothetical protein